MRGQTSPAAFRSASLTRQLLSVAGNEPVGPYTLLRVDRGDVDPGRPGQFFMLEAPGRLLPRPMSLCLAPPGELAFLIEALGRGTQALCALRPGEAIHVLGPLGNGFDLDVPAAAPRGWRRRHRAAPVPVRGARRAACRARLPELASRRSGGAAARAQRS